MKTIALNRYTNSDHLLKNVVQKLDALDDVCVKHIFGIFEEEKDVYQTCFQDAQIVPAEELFSLDYLIKSNNTIPEALSLDIINKFKEIESTFLMMTDRYALWPISVYIRKKIYYNYLLYWFHFFKTNKIDLVLFEETPHDCYDFIMFHVAKFLGIKTLYPEFCTCLNNRHFFLEDYHLEEKIPDTFLNNLTFSELLKYLGNDYEELIQKKSIIVSQMIDNYNQFNYSKWLHGIKCFLKKDVFSKKLIHGVAYSVRKAKISNFSYYCTAFFKVLKFKHLKKYYHTLTSVPQKNDEYILFPLHYQPERTTLPQGDIFVDQLLALRILSKSIPPGVKIYVKEHPSMFNISYISCMGTRSKTYYDEIIAMDNVCLVDISLDNSELIKNSLCVATITGTVGWEAMLEGVSTITFGNAWYNACNSCYRVTSIDMCKKAFAKIKEAKNDDVKKDVLRFVAFYKDTWVVTALNYSIVNKSSYDGEELIDNYVAAVVKYLNKNG